ncbi:MAG: L-seryl-tRNA(Sec) selenium transferase [Terriglobales bacterium]
MSVADPSRLLRQVPSLDELLRDPRLQADLERLGPGRARRVLRGVLEQLRHDLKTGGEAASGLAAIPERVHAAADALTAPSLRRVINATGVILHTNLGRAPLGAAAVAQLCDVAAGYTNLEYDLATGRRGKRDAHAETLLNELTGAERSLVVNNNAAAVLLTLNTLAMGGDVLVSRGELVEIGGSFRVPDIMLRSGARLVEVGTTNRTRIEDYRQAITPATRLILRVHRSNFQLVGFVEQPALSELADLGRQAGIPVAEDLGSGCLVDLEKAGLAHEPRVGESLAAGVDVVMYSGDKLLGGPQAGLLGGRRTVLDAIRANPMFRALRVDRLTYAALAATLQAYAREDYAAIPALRMIFDTTIGARAQAFVARLPPEYHAHLRNGQSVIGGGTTPGQGLPTTLIALQPQRFKVADLEARLRAGSPPVVTRIEDDRLLLDLRTVFPEQEAELERALRAGWPIADGS